MCIRDSLNTKIDSYNRLAQRIGFQLGAPVLKLEITQDIVYENISIAVELFTKFAGYTEEYLIFDSALYDHYAGIKLDVLFTITPLMSALSANYDFNLDNYRKVVDVFSFAEGNNSGVNTLFTIEHTIAQQAYFGHLLGNVGYDLITWHALKEWLDLREKLLALRPHFRFSPESQYLKLIPEPSKQQTYYGLIGCHVQKPIRDIVSQLWVYRYTLALSKITLGHVRGKYAGTNLFGNQTVNYTDVMSQGLAEKEKLEQEITSDLIDREPITAFFVG